MSGATGFLLIRVGSRRLGLRLDQVLEITPVGEVHAVPVLETSVRGLVRVHGRMLPLVHLGSLLEGGSRPGVLGQVGVIVSVAGRSLCLEIDDAEILAREPVLPVPPGEALPWAVGVARCGEGLVPILDLAALSSRLTEGVAT